jgi:hypothetical protein
MLDERLHSTAHAGANAGANTLAHARATDAAADSATDSVAHSTTVAGSNPASSNHNNATGRSIIELHEQRRSCRVNHTIHGAYYNHNIKRTTDNNCIVNSNCFLVSACGAINNNDHLKCLFANCINCAHDDSIGIAATWRFEHVECDEFGGFDECCCRARIDDDRLGICSRDEQQCYGACNRCQHRR